MARRLRYGTARLARVLRADQDRLTAAVYVGASTMMRVTEQVFEAVRETIATSRSPIAKLRRALGQDDRLRERPIVVDAVGDTLLLQGVVSDDDEWRRADLLARDASPDGTVRNLLRVEHHAEG